MDMICTQQELNKAATKVSLDLDLPFWIDARFTSPMTPDSTFSCDEDGVLHMSIPDFLEGMPYDVLRGLVAFIISGNDRHLEPLDEFTSTPSFLIHGQLLLRDRLDIRPPRQERDLKACFYRVCRANHLSIPEPMLGWSRLLDGDFLESITLRTIVFSDKLAHRGREELDDMMLGILESWEGYI